jgi:hypothetical protein
MAVVGVAGLVLPVVHVLEAALRDAGHSVARLPLGADTVHTLVHATVDALVLDGHPYVNMPALLEDLRRRDETRSLPVVVVGPTPPGDAPGGAPEAEGIELLGPAFALDDLLAAVDSAAGQPR